MLSLRESDFNLGHGLGYYVDDGTAILEGLLLLYTSLLLVIKAYSPRAWLGIGLHLNSEKAFGAVIAQKLHPRDLRVELRTFCWSQKRTR